MFYILSRLFACLASPVFYLLLVFTLAFVFRRRRKVMLSLLWFNVVFFLVVTNAPLYGYAERAWCSGCIDDIDTTKHYDYAILPGGMTGYDSLRHRIEYGEAGDRIVDAALLYNKGIVDKLIITGDGGCNADGDSLFFLHHMKDVYGVDADDILMERHAKNTIENFTLTLEQFGDSLAGKKIVVINSAVYMRRTKLCCRMTGLDCDFYSVDIHTCLPYAWDGFVPNFLLFDKWTRLAHEWIGYVAYQFY